MLLEQAWGATWWPPRPVTGGKPVPGLWRWNVSALGCRDFSWDALRWERGPPALPGHAGLSALLPTVRQLCPFPDPTFGEILHSGLNHFLSRPHSPLWESGPEPRPGSFLTLLAALPKCPPAVSRGLGLFFLFVCFDFLGSSQTVSSDPSPAASLWVWRLLPDFH